MGCAQT